jgi:hypothetical protein
LSSIAASRLLAAVMAWKSPVKCRLISSIGTTCAWPPPVAPPFWPKHGPRRGLAQADHRVRFADAVQRVAEADRGGGLALAGRRRADRGDQT